MKSVLQVFRRWLAYAKDCQRGSVGKIMANIIRISEVPDKSTLPVRKGIVPPDRICFAHQCADL